MTPPPAHRLLTRATADLAADARALDGLKRDAQRDPRGAVRQAAQQFEALFMQMVLRSMREATPKSGLFDSPAHDLYAGMLDQQIAAQVATSGTGLAEMIARQMMRQMGTAEDDAPDVGRRPSAVTVGSESPAMSVAVDRYAQLARPNPNGAARYAELAAVTSSRSAREAYLNRRDLAAGAPAAADGERPTADSPQDRFLALHAEHARAAQRLTGIPAPFILAQAALESGWGAAEIRDADGAPSFNLFGIKATGGWRGRTVDAVTTEVVDGVVRRTVERFRAYGSYGEAFRDWALLLRDNPRYAQVLAHGRDARGFAYGLQAAGYATDPDYGAKLVRVIAALAGTGRAGAAAAASVGAAGAAAVGL